MPELITDLDLAKRKARAIVSDVLIYNEDLVKVGIENDSLFDVLEEQIQEGRGPITHVRTNIKDHQSLPV